MISPILIILTYSKLKLIRLSMKLMNIFMVILTTGLVGKITIIQHTMYSAIIATISSVMLILYPKLSSGFNYMLDDSLTLILATNRHGTSELSKATNCALHYKGIKRALHVSNYMVNTSGNTADRF
jgi:hypothetical protein